MDISIVIVNYKSKEKLRACLESIANSDLKDISSEVIVIENNSGDNLKDLQREILNFKLVESDKNLGMGGGNNLGIRISQGDFVLILNPDTILKKDSIKILLDYIRNNPDVYIVGPKLLNVDSSLQLSCSYFPRPWTPIFRRTFLGRFFKKHLDWFLMKDFSHDIIKEVDWLMGSCLMIRKEGFEGFDERFFMYFEDIDVCRRAWKVDKKVVYNPRAEVIHHHARESAKHPWYFSIFKDKLAQEHIKSWFKYFKKWGIRK
ncbi:MAG TPA: glycosyltransferase family 2 protein [bacterium]|nr:glycosyltransferase family 2 protein [bacterium]